MTIVRPTWHFEYYELIEFLHLVKQFNCKYSVKQLKTNSVLNWSVSLEIYGDEAKKEIYEYMDFLRYLRWGY